MRLKLVGSRYDVEVDYLAQFDALDRNQYSEILKKITDDLGEIVEVCEVNFPWPDILEFVVHPNDDDMFNTEVLNKVTEVLERYNP